MAAQKITNAGFLSEFMLRHEKLKERPFCWVLGSGASIQSGIPTGKSLAEQWLKEMHEREDFDNLPLEKWATAKTLGIEGFEFAKAASFYPFIYQRRYRGFKDQGYAVLEDVMAEAEPSYGYSVLAQIMAGTEHKAAVTTNFDNLLADALAVYTSALPLVCGHESLTGFIRAKLRRPLIAKIHRDLLLHPMSSPTEIEKLPDQWADALGVIFQNFTPIVLGYGGNDGSLMGLLKELPPIEGGIFWCHRTGKELEPVIQEVVEHHQGWLVPILGFDELMLQLWEKLNLPSPLPELQVTHDKRKTEFQRQFAELNQKLREPGKSKAAEQELKPVREAAEAAIGRLTKERHWLAWELKARLAEDEAKTVALYREGLKDFPKSFELRIYFANYLLTTGQNEKEAMELLLTALKYAPTDARVNRAYQWFVLNSRASSGEAEQTLRQGMDLDSQFANSFFEMGYAVWKESGDMQLADSLFSRALSLAPNDTAIKVYYAEFLKEYEPEPS